MNSLYFDNLEYNICKPVHFVFKFYTKILILHSSSCKNYYIYCRNKINSIKTERYHGNPPWFFYLSFCVGRNLMKTTKPYLIIPIYYACLGQYIGRIVLTSSMSITNESGWLRYVFTRLFFFWYNARSYLSWSGIWSEVF